MKQCRTCRKYKTSNEFSPEKRAADKLGYRCKTCEQVRRKQNRTRNRERWAARDPYEVHLTGHKPCSKCKQEKPVREFLKNSHAGDGLQTACKSCQLDNWHMKNYGRMLREGSDTCEICGREESLSVDHDHTTGQTRGNLCRPCNTALGSFNDDPKLLCAAAKYIERWRSYVA